MLQFMGSQRVGHDSSDLAAANSLLMRVKKEGEKPDLKSNIQKTKTMAFGPITSWQIDGETTETLRDFTFWAPKSLQMVTTAMKLKRHLLLGRKAMTNRDGILKSKDITLPTKVHLVKAVVFPVVMCQEAFNRRLPVRCFGSVRNPLFLIDS